MNKVDILDQLIKMKWWAAERRLETKNDPDETEYQTWRTLCEHIKTTIAVVEKRS